jgi:hypothetical protein
MSLIIKKINKSFFLGVDLYPSTASSSHRVVVCNTELVIGVQRASVSFHRLYCELDGREAAGCVNPELSVRSHVVPSAPTKAPHTNDREHIQ